MTPHPSLSARGVERAVKPGEGAIGDYAIIGNCRSAALISRDGSLDWLCWPRFDSGALFSRLLDRDAGHFAVRPQGAFEATRRYVGATNVLETTFRTPTGRALMLDLMPVAAEREKQRYLWPEHEVLRRIECTDGELQLGVEYRPRPEFARLRAPLRAHSTFGYRLQFGARLATLMTDVPLQIVGDGVEACGHTTLRRGERRYLSLAYSGAEPAVIPALADVAEEKIRTSLDWWNAWSARCTYEGPYRDAVVRSALVLKLLTFAPSGAVIAAPTTSLPEKLGGVRNWDYRYCWLRDASLTLQALFNIGYPEEAESYLSWLLHTTRITWPKLRVMYDVYGSPDLKEVQLGHLAGFAESRPVRIGNAAGGQLQLDIYGEVLDAVHEFARRGGRLDRATRRMIGGLGATVCKCWRAADEGIWEVRGSRRHHTFSKAMCWVALDRLVKLHDAGQVVIARDRFVRTMQEIRDEIESRGFDARMGSYTAVYDREHVDASLLMLGRYGYADPQSARMLGTVEAVRARLAKNGLTFRYLDEDGLPPGEGAFGACCFWAVDALARSQKLPDATPAFEHLLTYANDLGLFGEQIDPESGVALGNFPQAFTHVALIDAAVTLARDARGESA